VLFRSFVASQGAAAHRGSNSQKSAKEPAAKKPKRTELSRIHRASRCCFSQSVEVPASDHIGSMLGAAQDEW
jgi:hypothetical protein